MTNTSIPTLFACCIPVMGTSRAIICDIQRKSYHFIPDSMYEVITEHKGKTIPEIQAAYNNEYDEIIQEYFDFLVEGQYVFYTETPERFPEMDLHWEEPTPLTNAIIDLDAHSTLSIADFERIFTELGSLGCEHIQIRSFSDRPLVFFEEILNTIGTKRIISVELIIKHQACFTKPLLFELCNTYPRIFSITAHSAPVDETLYVSSQGMGNIFFTTQKITSAHHCGIILPELFNINIKAFTEAQQYNSCLNKKISIDANGDIKNCPSMKKSFGNISDSSLTDALHHPDFKSLWRINKDQIETCKNCEFRYICTDCRAYIEQPDNQYSKPLKCGYNPATATWENWSKNPLKQATMNTYTKATDLVTV